MYNQKQINNKIKKNKKKGKRKKNKNKANVIFWKPSSASNPRLVLAFTFLFSRRSRVSLTFNSTFDIIRDTIMRVVKSLT